MAIASASQDADVEMQPNQRTSNSDNVDYASFRPVFNVVSMLYQLLFDIELMLISNIISMLSRC